MNIILDFEGYSLIKESTDLLELVNETVILRGYRGDKFDVTKTNQSIAGKLEPFFPKMSKMSVHELKDMFMGILNDKDCKVSQETREYWIEQMKKKGNAAGMMQMLSNLYLGAAHLHAPDSGKRKFY